MVLAKYFALLLCYFSASILGSPINAITNSSHDSVRSKPVANITKPINYIIPEVRCAANELMTLLILHTNGTLQVGCEKIPCGKLSEVPSFEETQSLPGVYSNPHLSSLNSCLKKYEEPVDYAPTAIRPSVDSKSFIVSCSKIGGLDVSTQNDESTEWAFRGYHFEGGRNKSYDPSNFEFVADIGANKGLLFVDVAEILCWP
ncbi:hypothetical protein DdX_15428 [Ditylenchus destructor]|uniref:Secreted protein n=1 Tax=Ditylenchus destructor TaxID=166010 RepID=A0AAD4MVC0_9BILA|nr:hypothetical protein DdX_15428 [Ditylenchus destructor]